MSNVFLVNPRLGPEDRFTAHWCCLLKAEPSLGQAVVDRLTQLAGIGTSRLIEIIEHPGGVPTERPDCLLRTEAFDIYCEHKLDASLGRNQLERYLALTQSRKGFLVLLGNQRLSIPESVYQSKFYLKPQIGHREHFLWSDVYSVFRRSRGTLARQFVEYMDHLGMNPWNWGKFRDPFVDETAADAFRSLYEPTISQLRQSGITSVRRKNSLGLQIRFPVPDVPLIYAGPVKWDSSLTIPLSGRLFVMTVWVKGNVRLLSEKEEFIIGEGPRLFTTWLDDSPALWKDNLFAERNYYASIEEVLNASLDQAKANISNVIHRTIQDLSIELYGKR
ncbi:MAG: hypothetical protein JNK38_27760 [Acidobacteria bacterium]|nr:hypothetical protein [Acidobacteriota bacterium]